MIKILANALIPVFVGLLAGYLAGLRKYVDNKNVKTLIIFVMSFAVPCALFATIARTPHQLLWGQGKIALVLVVVYGIIYAVTYFSSRILSKDSARDSSVLALTLTFPNIAAVGFPLLEAMYGAQQNIVVVVGIAVGAITITAITLAILEGGTAEGRALSTAACVRVSMWKALKKPVFWAPMLGIITVIIGLHLPSYLDRSLTIFANATAGSALFLTGLVVSAQRFELTWGVIWAVLVKNVLQPALCLGIARLMGLPLDLTRSVVLMTAIPCGFFGIVFGKHFDVTPPVASSGLIASYVVGIFSLAGWIIVLTYLH